jgi:hypothetical protein
VQSPSAQPFPDDVVALLGQPTNAVLHPLRSVSSQSKILISTIFSSPSIFCERNAGKIPFLDQRNYQQRVEFGYTAYSAALRYGFRTDGNKYALIMSYSPKYPEIDRLNGGAN